MFAQTPARDAMWQSSFARKMLAEAHVAATPGRDFDPLAGHRTMRFSYAGSHDEMVEAMARIERWLK